jgi:uncharacterized protein YjbI with pentapeptide repeats
MAWPLLVNPQGPIALGCFLWERRGRTRVTAIVKASFAMVHGGFAMPTDPLPIVTEETGEAASDLWPQLSLPQAIAHCDAVSLGREPVQAMAVRFVIWKRGFKLDKTVHVFGPRSSHDLAPEAFVQAPVTWESAPSGENGHNPVGVKGDRPARVISPINPAVPTSFAPLSFDRKERNLHRFELPKVGPIPWRWPDEVMPEAFSSAPRDQWLPTLDGDEWILLDGVHPELPRFATRLPMPVTRAQLRDESGRAEPFLLALDTLTVDTRTRTVSLVWRGSLPLLREHWTDLQVDASFELGVPEELSAADAPGPLALGKGLLLGPRPSVAVAPALPPPLPTMAEEQTPPLSASDTIPPPKLNGLSAMPFSVAPASRPSGASPRPPTIPPPAQRVPLAQLVPPPVQSAPPAPPLVPPPVQSAPPAPPPVPLVPPAVPLVPSAVPLVPSPALAAAVPSPPPPAATLVAESTDAGASLLRDKEEPTHEGARLDITAQNEIAAAPDAGPTSMGTLNLRTTVLGRVERKEPLKDLMLAGVDLSELNLAGANLAEANLAGTKLNGCNLSGARLAGAKLGAADLSGANLESADLTHADLSRAQLRGANFSDATLSDANLSTADGQDASFQRVKGARLILSQGRWSGASFEQAELPGSDFSGAEFDRCNFDQSNVTGARFVDARGSEVTFAKARMTDANLAGCQLLRCQLVAADAQRTSWDRATLRGSSFRDALLDGAGFARAALDQTDFSGASLTKASLMGVTGETCLFVGANLEAVDLRQGKLSSADFSKAKLVRCNALKATLQTSTFTEADLTGTSLRSAKLRSANFERAILRDADLRDADLELADLRGAETQGARLSGANLKGATEGGA